MACAADTPAPATAAAPAAVQPDQLRCLVQDCIAKHLYSTAVFYADKLVTLSDYAPGDVYLLAQAYYVSRQHRRAVLLLRQHGVMEDVRFRYLAAKCLAEVDEWDEVLRLLGDGGDDDDDDMQEASQRGQPGVDISTHAAVCLLRGKAFEALDNRQRAVACFTEALRADPFLEEALSALVGGHMLTNAQELALVDGLPLGPQDRWLALLYRARCKKYLQHDVMEAQLQELQQQPGSSNGSSSNGSGGCGGDNEVTMAPEPTSPAAAAAAAAGAANSTQQQPPGTSAQQQQDAATPPFWQRQQQRPSPTTEAAGPGPGSSAVAAAAAFPHRLPGRPGTGCGLGSNGEVLAARADWLLHQGRCEDAYQLTSAILAQDPYATQALTTHLTAALQLGKKNELFLRGHKLVEEYPDSSLAWFGVGCYYMAGRQHDQARRFFAKATQLDRHSAHAWVCFGHAFAEQDESDQALAAYRTAARLFPGLHTPLLGMGCAYGRMHNTHLAERCLLQAAGLCPQDPCVAHELGVLAYRNRQYEGARQWFTRALGLVPGGHVGPAWEPTVVNLAHVMRKLRRYDAAVQLYEQAIGLNPHNPGSHAGLAFTHQLVGRSAEAVEGYHKALGLRPDDAFAGEMLSLALQEECARFGHMLLRADPSAATDLVGGGPGTAPQGC